MEVTTGFLRKHHLSVLNFTGDLIYKAAGDTVELSPGPVSGPITSVTWKHGKDIAIEVHSSTESYNQFKGAVRGSK